MSDLLTQVTEATRNLLPLGRWVNAGVKSLLDNGATVFDSIGVVVEGFAEAIEQGMLAIPFWLVILVTTIVGFRRLGLGFGVFVALSLMLIVVTGFWPQTMVTLALTLSATIISLFFGIPLGIWCARNNHVNASVRPILDFMQTMPAFVYLIPAAMLFGLGRVPGTIATVIFAMPPGGASDQSGHPPGQLRASRGRQRLWLHRHAVTVQSAVAHCLTHYHGRG